MEITERQPAELSGVRGWLAFLVVCLLVLAPLTILGQASNGIRVVEELYPHIAGLQKWTSMKNTMWLFSVFQAIALFSAGLLLLITRLKSTIPRVILLMWVGGPVTSVVGILAISYQSVQSFSLLSKPSSVGDLAGSILGILLWTMYLKRSRRVKNTYVEV